MTDLQRDYDFSEVFTAVVPLGGMIEAGTITRYEAAAGVNEHWYNASTGQYDDKNQRRIPGPPRQYKDGEPTVVYNEYYGFVAGPRASEYGWIMKAEKYPDITDSEELLAAAIKTLEEVDFNPIYVEAQAVDLSFIDSRYTPFRVGKQYHVISTAHDVDTWLPLTKMEIQMDSAIRKITLGKDRRRAATDVYTEVKKQVDIVKDSIAPGIGGGKWKGSVNLWPMYGKNTSN